MTSESQGTQDLNSGGLTKERLEEMIRLHPAGSPIRNRLNRDVSAALTELLSRRSSADAGVLVNDLHVDDLAQIIRQVDGNNSLGAGALAEAIFSALATVSPAKQEPVGYVHGDQTQAFNRYGLGNISREKDVEAGLTRPLFASPQPSGGEGAKLTEKLVAWAMLEAWQDICSDTGCHPLDIEQVGRKRLEFSPQHWARFTAQNLMRALSTSPAPEQQEVSEAMVEAAAKAIAENHWSMDSDFIKAVHVANTWQHHSDDARAALTAAIATGETP